MGTKRDDVIEDWWRLHNEELNGLYSSLNIVRVIKSGRIRWRGGGERCIWGFVGKPQGRDSLQELGVGERIVLK